MSKVLREEFFNQGTIQVAQKLLGKFLVTPSVSGMIFETEAYCGKKDLACHSARGRTARTEVMFGRAGRAYIYMIYGMYYCFNIVTRSINQPEAVLIRGVGSYAGPARVCQGFGITKKLNGFDLTKKSLLWIEDRGVKIRSSQIIKAKRIGIDYAKEYKDKKWRFYIKGYSK